MVVTCATRRLAQAISLGTLSGSGGNLGNNVSPSSVTYTVGTLNANTTFSGNIVDSVGGGARRP